MPSEASIGVKAAVIREKSGEFHIEDLCLETPRRDEVLVRIENLVMNLLLVEFVLV